MRGRFYVCAGGILLQTLEGVCFVVGADVGKEIHAKDGAYLVEKAGVYAVL